MVLTAVKLWEERVLPVLPKSCSPDTPRQPGGKSPKPGEILGGNLRDQESWDRFSFLFSDSLRIQELKPRSGP